MLIGRLGKKPEVRYVKEDTPVARFTLATDEYYRDSNTGETKSVTQWHNIVAWRQLAKFVETYLDKGMLVYIEGKIQNRSWTGNDNTQHYTSEIVAENLRVLEKRSDNTTNSQQNSSTQQQTTTTQNNNTNNSQQNNNANTNPFGDYTDDNTPF